MKKRTNVRFEGSKKQKPKSLLYLGIALFSLLFMLQPDAEVDQPVVQEDKIEDVEVTESSSSKEEQKQEAIALKEEEREETQEEFVAIFEEEREDIPVYATDAYTTIHNNRPYFTKKEMTTESFEYYSELDGLGRCGPAIACVGIETMPTEKRGSIGMVKPSGWHTIRYDDLIDGKYLYNRCHLIGYQLTGENANVNNLITGTRYLNMEGMLPFENEIADYIERTNHHVLYRVTPDFQGDDLVAKGVLMEAISVEDNGKGLMFCVYAYNIQPGIRIDYATGNSERIEASKPKPQKKPVQAPKPAPKPVPAPKPEKKPAPVPKPEQHQATYIINVNTGKFHVPSCPSVKRMKDSNKLEVQGSRDELVSQGYSPCLNCNP